MHFLHCYPQVAQHGVPLCARMLSLEALLPLSTLHFFLLFGHHDIIQLQFFDVTCTYEA